MRTLAEKYLGGWELKEDIYKVDFAILDRYQTFSAELLRLALLGIAGYGFLISSIVLKGKEQGDGFSFVESFTRGKGWLVASAVALGLCAMAALGHRYFSTDCVAHFVRRVRSIKKHQIETDSGEKARLADVIKEEERSLGGDLDRCRWLLILACLFLAIGIGCFAVVVGITIFAPLSDASSQMN